MLNILYRENTINFTGLISVVLLVLIYSLSLNAQNQQSEFTLQIGFGGYSEGDGWLKMFFGQRKAFHVVSHGYEQADGTFRLDQTITFQGKQPQKRHWILTKKSKQYTGTLSDVTGKVTGQSHGAHLKLRYRIKGPIVMHQSLNLLPDGKTIDNVGKITLFGIPIGSLHETITNKN
jgi:hypothetical protein